MIDLEINSKLHPKRIQKLSLKSQEYFQIGTNQGVALESNKIFRKLPAILFDYQAAFIKAFNDSKNKILVWEKARRIGATHGIAALAVLEASKAKGKNFFYIGTNLAMAKEFLDSCAYWAKQFQIASGMIGEELYHDESKDILALRIKFKSGKKIAALSSKPASIRGLQGHVLLDESAFVEHLDEFLKAIKAMLVWGNKVMVVSTHDGINNPFNILCESIKKSEFDYYIQKTTFKDAIADGLYQRICLVTNQAWTLEKEFEWIKEIYKQYGNGASEELDVIPAESSVNAIFKKADFQILEDRELPEYFDYTVIGFDTAATEKTTSCYSTAIVIGKLENNFYILDFQYTKSDALKTQEFILYNIQKHGKLVPAFVELEGGSQSLLYFENALKPSLPGYKIIAVKPEGSKLVRAIPAAEKVKEGRVFLKKAYWNDDFLDNISQFDGTPGIPLITDVGDALSLAYQQVNKGFKGLAISGTVKSNNNKNRYSNRR